MYKIRVRDAHYPGHAVYINILRKCHARRVILGEKKLQFLPHVGDVKQ